MARRWGIDVNETDVSSPTRTVGERVRVNKTDDQGDQGDVMDMIRSAAEPIKETVESYIRSYPGRSLLIAAIAGVTVGWWVKR